jgi:hypothetical protein
MLKGILFLLIILIFIFYFLDLFIKPNKERFINNENEFVDNLNGAIISKLSGDVGFYSMFFFTLNHYIYSKKNNNNFQINSNEWLFKSNEGWNDYFISIPNYINSFENNKIYQHGNILENFTILDYKNSIKDIYIYNKQTDDEINKIKTKFNLINNNYDSIFIRRGDKLTVESKYYKSEDYIELLLKINPESKIIFLQTDDYNSYLELKQYINSKNLNINLITLCPENSYGVIINDNEKNKLINNKSKFSNNESYIKDNIDKFKDTKPVSQMNSEEKYKHTIDLIVGVDILINSNICICDFQSNVSRFVKLAHNNSDNVYDIIDPYTKIDYSKKICPSYSF